MVINENRVCDPLNTMIRRNSPRKEKQQVLINEPSCFSSCEMNLNLSPITWLSPHFKIILINKPTEESFHQLDLHS